MAEQQPAPEEQTFDCPKCATEVTERFYGPCDECRQALRTTVVGKTSDAVAAEYEPKMNVTPNAVALKE